MSADNPIYQLIPAIYRQRDALLGLPLEALTEVLNLEYEALRADVGSLYEQWFIETCSRWAVPYIGTLLGIEGIETDAANVDTQRARVANTVGYRSRRGVAAILANACADASGWPGVAVEYFERVILSEHVGALEQANPHAPASNLREASVDVSDVDALADIDGPFSTLNRTVDVSDITRPRVHTRGWTPEYYNLPNLGLFFWRIRALPIERASPGSDGDDSSFHPLGIDTPLLFAPHDRVSPWLARTKDELPLPITRRELGDTIASWRRTLASDPSQTTPPDLGFVIRCDDVPIPVEAIHVIDERGKLEPPEDGDTSTLQAWVDPERGRFRVYASTPGATITVDWAWGQPGWLGGGAYDRNASMVEPSPTTEVILVSRTLAATAGVEVCRDLNEALVRIEALRMPDDEPREPREILIRIVDSATYEPPASIDLYDEEQLVIQALDGVRPTVLAQAGGALRVRSLGTNARLLLSGLLIGDPVELEGDMEVVILDSTLAPLARPRTTDRSALRWGPRAAADAKLFDTISEPALAQRELSLLRCIVVGPLAIASAHTRVTAVETILDGGEGFAVSGFADASEFGPTLVLDAVTVLGSLRTVSLDAVRDSIITGCVFAASVARQLLDEHEFCLELGLDVAETTRFPRPAWLASDPFTSTRYAEPGYCQLRLDAGPRLLRRASDDREFGAYHSLATGQRLANLAPVIEQYLPHGLAAGIFLMS